MPSKPRMPRTARNPIAAGLSTFGGGIATCGAHGGGAGSLSGSGDPRYGGDPRYSALGGGAALPTLPAVAAPAAPKHFPFPPTAADSDLLFECVTFVFAAVAAGLQFLHLYKSVWWLPNSYTQDAMNFYLIDLNLIMFIMILLSRKVVYILGLIVVEFILPSKYHDLGVAVYRLFLFAVIFTALGYYTFYVLQNNPIVNIFYLCYPILVYVILFGMKVAPFFETVHSGGVTAPPPLHACTNKAAEIRTEVENLKVNFNCRMKQILFCSILNAYYAAFIPCCFAQNFVYYCAYWVTQHVLFVFLSCFAAHTMHILPLRYCDILHRATLHLGGWDRVEAAQAPRSVLMPVAYSWSPETLFPCGTLVRHGRDLYRAHGETNAAEPGNPVYTRFYAIFKNPASALWGVLAVHGFVVLFQLILLLRSTYWYHMVSITLVLFYNYYVLFKLVRDYFISYKIYRAEQALHEKVGAPATATAKDKGASASSS